MANLNEVAVWEAAIYQLETTDPVLGGPDGIDNVQAKQLANRTLYLKSLCEALGDDKQPLATMLVALAALATAANQTLYFTGPDAPALTGLSPFARTLLDDIDAAAARATLGAVTQADINTAIANLVASSPAALDTLKELATALGNDPNFATTMTNALAAKAPLASPALTGTPTAPTAAVGTNTTQLATTAFVKAAVAALSTTLSGLTDIAIAALADKHVLQYDNATGKWVNRTLAAAGIAALASPALTGTPTAPTAAGGTNTTQLATTAFVATAIANLVASSPAALDTLNELAAALGNDPNFATTMTNALAAKAPLANPALTGTPTAPTAAPGTNTTQLATTAFVKAAVAEGSAVGPHTISIPAGALRPRATNGCAPLAVSAGAAGQPDVDYLAFDASAVEYAKITVPMPKGWNEGTVKAEFQWRRASGVSAANVVWGMRAVAVGDGDTPVTNFGVNATVTDDAKTATANFSFSGQTGECTIGGVPAEGDLVMFEFFRLANDAADTLDGVDAQLTSIRLVYTTSAATDA